VWWFVVGFLVLVLVAIVAFKVYLASFPSSKTVLPQVVSTDTLKKNAVSCVYVISDGIVRLSNTGDPPSGNITLQKIYAHRKWSGDFLVGVQPSNPAILQNLASSMAPNVRLNDSGFTVSLVRTNDDELTTEMSFILEKALLALGVKQGDAFILDYSGGYDLKAIWAYWKRYRQKTRQNHKPNMST